MQSHSTLKDKNPSSLIETASTTIITHSEQNFKSQPQAITIRDMLENVEDADGNVYFQVKGLQKQPKEHNGFYSVPEQAIKVLQTADYSTLPHEFAHFWLENIWTYAKRGKASETFLRKKKKLSF